MVRYIRHNQIDKQRWDDCIARSVNRRVYAFSWYLDQVCPGWDAVINDDYLAVFPLTMNRKWGITYLYQPYFTQQLGVFSEGEITSELMEAFFLAIPEKVSFAEIQLNAMNNFQVNGWELKTRLNHELPLNFPYSDLYRNYSQNTRRNLKKAGEAGVSLGEPPSTESLIDLFKNNFGEREGKLKQQHYATIQS